MKRMRKQGQVSKIKIKTNVKINAKDKHKSVSENGLLFLSCFANMILFFAKKVLPVKYRQYEAWLPFCDRASFLLDQLQLGNDGV